MAAQRNKKVQKEKDKYLLTLITQRPLSGAPLEALNDAVFD